MEYNVGDLLESLFDGAILTRIVTPAQPVVVEVPTPIVETEWAAVVEVHDFDSLSLPGEPCPVCQSLKEWTDLLGRRRCGVCERTTLDKAIQWANRAAQLRERAQRQKPTPRIALGCVATGRVDILDVGSNRPLQEQRQAVVEREDGQEHLARRGELRQTDGYT